MENLNKEQLAAVTHKEGPVLIVAGAGTGKTSVITQRIAYIIEQNWAKPEEILALTFTEKAASEMEERVDRLLPMGYLDLWISTFHSFGERILKEYGTEIGIPADAKLLNEFEQWALIKKNLDKFDLNYYRPLGNPTKFIQALVKHFSRLKDEDISPEQYLDYAEELKQNLDAMLSGAKKKRGTKAKDKVAIADFCNAEGVFDAQIAEQEVLRINEAANAYHLYQQLLLDNNALDFGDLINYSLKLFRERLKILAKYRKQFKYILLDEFQDTNWAQYELIKLLAAPKNNLVVVGDDDQSIYKFRGASVSNILQFKKDFSEAKEIVLVKNYRSRQNILDLSYKFIQLNNPNRLECKLNGEGKKNEKGTCLDKKLVAQNEGEGAIEVIEADNVQEEIKKVIERIEKLKESDREASWNDFGILVRANDSAKEICAMLDKKKLPYVFLASRGLYAKPIIIDVISYFKMLDNYHESTALYRVLNIPVFTFSYKELVDFNYIAHKKAWSLFSTLKSLQGKMGAETQAKVDKLLNLIDRHTALVRDKAASEIFLSFINDSGYLENIAKQEDKTSQEAISYLNQFMKRIQKFEAASDDKSIKAFLNELDMEIGSGEQGAIAPDTESGPEAIKVMTVHGAKGLEFKYAFITNLVDKRFPTIERKEQIEIPTPLIKETLPEGDFHLEEERRLFYVAMTRAKEGLYFSWSSDYGGARKKKPSRFLVECGLVVENEKKKSRGKKEKDGNENLKIAEKEIVATSDAKYELPTYISYTQIAAFSNCPYQYRFAHILQVPRRGKAQFSFGRTMHSTLQRLFELINEKRGLGQTNLFGEVEENNKKIKISLDEFLEIYKGRWVDEWYESAEQKERYKKLGREILKEFYDKYSAEWPKALFLEKKFNIKIEADKKLYTIKGVIDRVDEVDGKIKIVDYKTGAPKEKLTFEEKEQLLIYQMAVSELFSQKVNSLAFYYLDNNSEVEFLGTDEELAKVKEKVIATIKEINQGEFLPKPGVLCKYCDYFGICEHRAS
ncbi:MAG: ATP-dependent DNA helicase PcrA [Parcubacteria group bacterium ADurb.Bin316]|nr:MAG: ATP-dependent DNA helicase PcrA [Parcubacteria group bacterium ADurb.Bin316]